MERLEAKKINGHTYYYYSMGVGEREVQTPMAEIPRET